jgi:hypothetical protein
MLIRRAGGASKKLSIAYVSRSSSTLATVDPVTIFSVVFEC